MKISVGVAPVGAEELEKLPQYNSRKFPVVELTNARAQIFPQEDEDQNLGLGFQPILILRGAAPGEVDLETIQYPTSMAVKNAAVMLLQGSTKPNNRLNATKWKEAVETDDFVGEKTTLLWPAPRMEDDNQTSDLSASVETDGELKNIIAKETN